MDKLMKALESMNKLDKENDYFITKKEGEYIVIKVDKNGCVWDMGFANCEVMIRKVIMGIYGELWYKSID